MYFISQYGVLKTFTPDARLIKKYLNITEYPVYIVFDSQEAIIVENNFDMFYEKFQNLLDSKR